MPAKRKRAKPKRKRAEKSVADTRGKRFVGFHAEDRGGTLVLKATWLCPTDDPDAVHLYTATVGKGIALEAEEVEAEEVERQEGESAIDAESRVNTARIAAQNAANAEAEVATARAQGAEVAKIVDTDAFREVWAAMQAATSNDAERVAKSLQ